MTRLFTTCCRLPGLATGLGLLLALGACSSPPPSPRWQSQAVGALAHATEAYLSGDDRVAQQEHRLALKAASATGRADDLAHVVLTRCAVQVASLAAPACADFEALRVDAGPATQAYADFLAGRVQVSQVPWLPAHYHGPLAASPQADLAATLAGVQDPLARLVLAGVWLQQGRASPAVVALASQTASAQGWRRPLLAWLAVQARLAEQAGQLDDAQRLRRQAQRVGSPQGQGAELLQNK